MRVARVQAQAKINKTLHVLDRDEATGYHELVTLFHRIDLADEVVVRADVARRTLTVTGSQVPLDGLGPVEKNLAYLAALEFANRAGWPDGFEIHLTKNIPVGGGLGGGSADAGAVLRALNALVPKPLSEHELDAAARALGADVPFLAKEWVTAIGTGHGADLKNLPPILPPEMLPAPAFVVIAVPAFSIRTADAYRWLDQHRTKSGRTLLPPIRPIEIPVDADELHGMSPREQMRYRDAWEAKSMVNDFEPVIEARFPELRHIRERLVEKGAFAARLAGSGSCVFGLFRDTPPTDAELAVDAQLLRTRISSRVVQVEVLE